MHRHYIFFLLAAIPLLADSFFVDNQLGDDANSGLTADKPFKTLAAAAKRLKAGDTLNLAPGRVFYESLVFKSSGTPDRPITVNGNGSVISGLAPVPQDAWKALGNGLYLNPNSMAVGARRPRVLDEHHGMISVEHTIKPDNLLPGQAVWNGDGIYYRAKDDVAPSTRKLYGFYRDSGLAFNNNSYITVNHVISENNANDGYNVHGYCRGLVFRNIVGRWNGDDGFSIHEDVQALVIGAHLHHNDFGIQDISLSRSQFFGVLSEDNRLIGADLIGGFRSIDDSLFRNNATCQIRVATGQANYHGIHPQSHAFDGQAYFRNVLVTGGNGPALRIANRASVTAVNCSFLETDQGIHFTGAELGLHDCVVAHAKELEFVSSGNGIIRTSGNDFYPGRASIQDKRLEGNQLLAALHDTTSLCEAPAFREHYHAARPRIIAGKQSVIPGFNPDVPLAFVPETPERYSLQNAPQHYSFDFESVNPWCRTYCDSDKKGTVKHSAELSTEQHVSGKSSVKIQYVFPPSDKAQTMYGKLFSVPFQDIVKPVSEWKFALHSDASNAAYKLRIRDKSGEFFYGPQGKFDWTGWKTIDWKLAALPPDIKNGDGNQTQNPPLELVIDFWVEVPKEGKTVTFYIDDLFFQ